jgi:hypothetical protein
VIRRSISALPEYRLRTMIWQRTAEMSDVKRDAQCQKFLVDLGSKMRMVGLNRT